MIHVTASRTPDGISWISPDGTTRSLNENFFIRDGFVLQTEDSSRIYLVTVRRRKIPEVKK